MKLISDTKGYVAIYDDYLATLLNQYYHYTIYEITTN